MMQIIASQIIPYSDAFYFTLRKVNSLNRAIRDKMSKNIPASFSVYFRLFYEMTNQIKSDKSIDGVLGTRNQVGRMEGVDESTEPICMMESWKGASSSLWHKTCVNMYQLLSVESARYDSRCCIWLVTRIRASNWREDRIKCRLVVGTASLTVLLLRHM